MKSGRETRRPNSTAQYECLKRHFFARFFDFEAISAPEIDPIEKNILLFKILAFLVMPGALSSLVMFWKYSFYVPVADYNLTSLTDKCFILSLSMILLAIVTVFEWDGLFPDRKDYLILTHLPIETRTIFLAKIAALAAFILTFTVAIGAVPAVLIPGALLPMGTSLYRYVHYVVSHSISMLLGNALVFLSAISLQGFISIIFPARVVPSISRYVRFSCLLLLLCGLLSIPGITRVDQHIHNGTLMAACYPPIWFVGIYEVLLGSHDPALWSLAGRAVAALAVMGALFILTYAACYRKFTRKIIDSGTDVSHTSAIRTAGNFLLDRWFLRRPEIRAFFHFVGQTIFRSPRHTLYVGSFLAVGLSIAVMYLVAIVYSNNASTVLQLDQAILSIPLILSFSLLAAMRVSFAVPVDLNANWLFRLAPKQHVKCSHAGVRKFLIGVVIIPLFACVASFYALIWDWHMIMLSVCYGITLSLILMELLLSQFAKIPFTCSYLPGALWSAFLWPLYVLGFIFYGYTGATLETWLLADSHRFLYFYGIAGAILLVLAQYNARSSEDVPRFEEESTTGLVYLDVRK